MRESFVSATGEENVDQRQGSSSRNNWVSLSLEAYKNGSYHSLEEARQLLGYADERSLRKPIKSLCLTIYSNPLNRNFALISHQDLEVVATFMHRQLAVEAPRAKPVVRDADVARQLADLQIQYAREVSALERRIALVEELRAQDLEVYEQRIASMQEQHDRVVAQLRETIKNIQGKLRSTIRGKRSEAPFVTKGRRGTISRLPQGYESLDSFASLHHISTHTLEVALQSGSLPVIQGKWRLGDTIISDALDPAGQMKFYQLFHLHEEFHLCERCQPGLHVPDGLT